MKQLLAFLLLCLSTLAFAQITEVRINELEPDVVGTDTTGTEFVELFGPPNQSLDGLIIVFITGASDDSYDVYDLTGHTTDEAGFFVLGGQNTPNVDLLLIPNPQGSIQNGADAVVLIEGSALDWPMGTPANADFAIDAIVYG
ncbi:MAG: endonuclease I, partial [Flavobacteriales bacterium]